MKRQAGDGILFRGNQHIAKVHYNLFCLTGTQHAATPSISGSFTVTEGEELLASDEELTLELREGERLVVTVTPLDLATSGRYAVHPLRYTTT